MKVVDSVMAGNPEMQATPIGEDFRDFTRFAVANGCTVNWVIDEATHSLEAHISDPSVSLASTIDAKVDRPQFPYRLAS